MWNYCTSFLVHAAVHVQFTAINSGQRSSDCHVLIQMVMSTLIFVSMRVLVVKTELGEQMRRERLSLHTLTDWRVNTQREVYSIILQLHKIKAERYVNVLTGT